MNYISTSFLGGTSFLLILESCFGNVIELSNITRLLVEEPKKKRFKVLSERGRRLFNPKGYLKPAIGRQEGSSNESFQVKPFNLVTPSTEHDKKEHSLSISTSTSIENGTSFIPIESEDGSFMRHEYAVATVYEEFGDNTEIFPMKREHSDLNLQPKGEIFSHGSSNHLDSYALEKETSNGISVEVSMIQGGNVRNPTWLMQTAFMNYPALTRSCSNIEIRQIKQWINLCERSSSCSIFKNLSGVERIRISRKSLRSSFSSRISDSADCKMLSSLSMSQVLPSHCRMILRKPFLLRHRSFQKPGYPQRIIVALIASNQKGGNLSDSHESGQKTEESRKKENQSAAISLGTSQIDRVSSWISNLDIDDFCDVKEKCDKQTAVLTHMALVNSSENKISDTFGSAAEVEKVNDIIQSLNTFSSVAHFCYLGLNNIPSMLSAFLCLRSINLSGNNIDSITPGSLPKSLHTLDLGWNKISTIEGLKDLERLRVLNLSHNRITRISHGLANCTLIKELYLSGNKISNVEGLHRILKLRVLDLSFNKIITAKALGQLVANYDSILALNLQGNPLQRNISDDQLRKTVLSLLPHVVYLNKRPVKPERVREVMTESVAKAALRDTALSSKRKTTRRLSQGLRSSAICRIGDTSLRDNSSRTIKDGKGRQHLAGRCKDEIGPIHM